MSVQALDFFSILEKVPEQGYKWRIEGKIGSYTVRQVKQSGWLLLDLIDFVRLLKGVTQTARKYPGSLKDNLKVTNICYANLRKNAFLMDKRLRHSNRLLLLINKICCYLFTKTTFLKAIHELRCNFVKAAPSGAFPVMDCLSLRFDAEEALKSEMAYQEVAAKYKLPSQFQFHTTNPILWHLKHLLTTRWVEIEAELKKGNTFSDPSVVLLCDSAMQTLNILAKLLVKRELEALIKSDEVMLQGKKLSEWPEEKKLKGMLMCTQAGYALSKKQIYPWILYTIYQGFYLWLRSCPTYDHTAKQWKREAADNLELSKKFYDSGEPQRHWAECWNGFVETLLSETDVAALKEHDHRFYTVSDDLETFELFQKGESVDLLKHSHCSIPFNKDHGASHHKPSGTY